MTRWLNMDPTLTEEQNQALTEDVLGRLERHVNPQMARNLRLLHEEFIEWRSEGCYVYDPMGRPYFDAVGAGGVFALGHSHPEVVGAVHRQLDRGGLSVRTGLVPGQLELLERLSRRVPGQMPFGYIGSTGTEAMEAALKLARLTTGRPGLVGMQMGYHGMSVGTLSISGIPYWREGFSPLLEPVRLVPFGDLKAAREAVDSTTAAVFLEPVQWASACSVAPAEYLQGLRRLCDETGALLILDEIQCGLGRTGRWFAADHSGVVPDMISVGKALSGGVMPISALMFNQAMALLLESSTFPEELWRSCTPSISKKSSTRRSTTSRSRRRLIARPISRRVLATRCWSSARTCSRCSRSSCAAPTTRSPSSRPNGAAAA